MKKEDTFTHNLCECKEKVDESKCDRLRINKKKRKIIKEKGYLRRINIFAIHHRNPS